MATVDELLQDLLGEEQLVQQPGSGQDARDFPDKTAASQPSQAVGHDSREQAPAAWEVSALVTATHQQTPQAAGSGSAQQEQVPHRGDVLIPVTEAAVSVQQKHVPPQAASSVSDTAGTPGQGQQAPDVLLLGYPSTHEHTDSRPAPVNVPAVNQAPHLLPASATSEGSNRLTANHMVASAVVAQHDDEEDLLQLEGLADVFQQVVPPSSPHISMLEPAANLHAGSSSGMQLDGIHTSSHVLQVDSSAGTSSTAWVDNPAAREQNQPVVSSTTAGPAAAASLRLQAAPLMAQSDVLQQQGAQVPSTDVQPSRSSQDAGRPLNEAGRSLDAAGMAGAYGFGRALDEPAFGHALDKPAFGESFMADTWATGIKDGQQEGDVLQAAEAAERSLLAGHSDSPESAPPSEQLETLLQGARQDWPAQGRPDASGAMVGGSVALKLEEVQSVVPELSAAFNATASSPRSHLHGHVGKPKVVALQGPVVAVGTSLGVTLVVQLPSITAAAAAAAAGASHADGRADAADSKAQLPPGSHQRGTPATHTGSSGAAAGHQASTSTSGAPLLVLGEPRSEAEAITALGLSRVDAAGEALWLLAGHASGSIVVWDLQRRPARQLLIIGGQHGLPVTHASFFPARGVSQCLTADRRGRLVFHTLSTNLLLMRTTVSSKPLLDGSLGIISDVIHLQPYPASLAALPGLDGMPVQAGGRPASGSGAPAAASGQLLGDGVAALCTPMGCHIARFRPTGDLILLMVIPRPANTPSGALPTAAWVSHTRRSFAPPILTQSLPRTSPITGTMVPAGAVQPPSPVVPGSMHGNDEAQLETVNMPCASMAVSWGNILLFCDVPLLGDHRVGAGSAGPGTWADTLLASQAAVNPQSNPAAAGAQAIAQNMGMSLLRGMTAAAAATTSRVVGGPAEPLTPQVVKQLNLVFPVQVQRKWDTAALDEQMGRDSNKDTAMQQEVTAPTNHADTNLPIIALHWYDGDALGVVVQQGLQMRLAVIGPDLEIREQVDCFDTPSPSPHFTTTTIVPCCPEAACGHGSRIVLLGSSGTLYCSRLMSWQERLRTLQDVGKTRLALWYSMEFYKMHVARKHAAAASGEDLAAAGLAAPHQLMEWVLQLLSLFARHELQELVHMAQPHGRVDPSSQQRCMAVARLCVCCCLVLGQQQPLFQQLFGQFQQAQQLIQGMTAAERAPQLNDLNHGVTHGQVILQPLAAFLEALEPHILADRMPCLAPEVVQALVQHFAGTQVETQHSHTQLAADHGYAQVAAGQRGGSQTQRVERCVLHLDVFNLDLDQVIRLCMAHGLLSALTYVYNRIGEYRLPAVHMLSCLAAFQPAGPATPDDGIGSTSSRQALRAVARKLLVYLRCLFRGEAFPPGSGSLADTAAGVHGMPADMNHAEELRAQLLGTLLFTDAQDLAREWQQPVERVQAVVRDPFPALQLLLAADAAATVHVLGEAVSGWDAVETELRAAAGKPAQELDSVLVATQVLVNALVTLLGHLPETTAKSSTAQRTAILDFVTALVTARRVTVPPAFVLQLLPHILEPPPGSNVLRLPAAVQATAHSGIPSHGRDTSGVLLRASDVPTQYGYQTSTGSLQHVVEASSPAEHLAMCLLDVVGVNAIAATRMADDRLNTQESAAAIQLLLQHDMRLAAACVHDMRGEIAQSLALHLQLTQPMAPFLYIHSCLQTGSPATRQALLAAVLASGKQLAASSPAATAAAVIALDPAQQQAILEQVMDDPASHYAVLTALLALSERLHKEGQHQGLVDDISDEQGQTESSNPLDIGHASAPLHTQAAEAAQGQGGGGVGGMASGRVGEDWLVGRHAQLVGLLLPAGTPPVPQKLDLRYNTPACNDYVTLACRFNPASVLPFLLRHTAYSVHQCLAAVQQTGIREAHAYLLERLGELSKAFDLHLTRIAEACHALQQVTWPSNHPTAHIAWLLALSPRARITLPQICGQKAVEQAAHELHQHNSAAGASHSPAHVTAPPVLEPGTETVGSSLSAIPIMPAALKAFWDALNTTTAFCQRCSRAEKLRPTQLQSTHRDGTTQLSRLQPTPSLTAQPASSYWIHLLEVLIQQASSCAPLATASAGTTQQGSAGGNHTASAASSRHASSPATQLHDVLAAAVEEVVGCAAEHVQLAVLVRHVSEQHGDAAVGQFRHLLAGLLSACSYEQAIMQAALRLLAHDAIAQVHARCNQHSSCVTELQVVGVPTSAAPTSATTSAIAGQKPAQLALVSDKVHSSLIPPRRTMAMLTNQQQQQQQQQQAGRGSAEPGRRGASGSRAAGQSALVFESSFGTSEGTAALNALAAVGLDLLPVQLAGQVTEAGDFRRLGDAPGRVCVRASLSLPLHQHKSTHIESPNHAGAIASSGAFDVDNLLEWAAAGAAHA